MRFGIAMMLALIGGSFAAAEQLPLTPFLVIYGTGIIGGRLTA